MQPRRLPSCAPARAPQADRGPAGRTRGLGAHGLEPSASSIEAAPMRFVEPDVGGSVTFAELDEIAAARAEL